MDNPAGAETPVSTTGPLKPRLDRVIVDVELEPAWKVAGEGEEAEMRKLAETPSVRVTWCDNTPLEDETVTR